MLTLVESTYFLSDLRVYTSLASRSVIKTCDSNRVRKESVRENCYSLVRTKEGITLTNVLR